MKKFITIKSDFANVPVAESLVDFVAEKYNVGEALYGNMIISIVEAVYNALLHGNKLDPSKEVTVEYEFNEPWLIFYVSDEGNGFDYNNLPDPTSPENIEKLSGRGIYLIKNLADEVIFHNGGSKIEIRFKLA